MPFKPTFKILRVLKDASKVFVQDTTVTGSDGYGSTGVPNLAAFTSIILSTGIYDQESFTLVPLSTPYTVASLATEAGFTTNVPDGVIMIRLYYGLLRTISSVISSDRLSITITNASTLFDGMTFISYDGVALIEIDHVSGDTVFLKTAIPGTTTSYAALYSYFVSEQLALFLLQADISLVKDIQKVFPGCDIALLKIVMLKFSLKKVAEENYLVNNLSKANEAAELIAKLQCNHKLIVGSYEQ